MANMPQLNDDQRGALEIANSGHNLLIIGSVGVGKTFTMRTIAQSLQEKHNVQMTASTGMARLQYVNAKTLHHWSGYGDGHLSRNTLLHEICTNPGYEDVRQRVLNTDVLMIDEIGLISAKMFDTVEMICRTVRNSDEYFGGIQVIAAGSYVQLPPVPSANDPALYTFTSAIFNIVFPHRIVLKKVIRQHEQDLIVSINEMCEGFPSQATHLLMRYLKRPLQNNSNAVYIFGTNFDVDFYNHLKLEKLQTQNKLFEAENEGDRRALRTCSVPHNLVLKDTCKVIVIRNLDNGLVNGLTGIVTKVEDNCVHIQIENDPNLGHDFGKKEFKIQKYTFVIRNSLNKIVGIRKQLPLKLGYAITVHKAQGRSISKVVVDAYNFWRPGQLGVPVGRSVCKDGLQVQNYSEIVASLQHPPEVHIFARKQSEPLKADLSCCRMKTVDDVDAPDIPPPADDTDNNDEDHFLIEMGDEEDRECMLAVNISLPWSVTDLVNSIKYEGESVIHLQRNNILEQLGVTWSFRNYLCETYEHLSELLEMYRVPPKGKKCNWCVMCSQLHRYFSSTKYLQRAKKAVQSAELSPNLNAICTRTYFVLLEKILEAEREKKLDLLLPKSTTVISDETLQEIPDSEKAVLRYVAGACINYVEKKIKSAASRQFIGKVYSAKLEYTKRKLLLQVRVPRDFLIHKTDDPSSLLEVIRREHASGGLIYVSHEAFHFFKVVYLKVKMVQNDTTIELNPTHVLQRTVTLLMKDMQILELWCRLFQSADHNSNSCTCTEAEIVASDGESRIKDVMDYELQQIMVMDLLDWVLNYFCKVHLSDVLSQLKDRKDKSKSLSLRHSLGTSKSMTNIVQNPIEYPCVICQEECIDIVEESETPLSEFSVECNKCMKWVHYKCADIKGDEAFLDSNSSVAFHCLKCKRSQSVATALSRVAGATANPRKATSKTAGACAKPSTEVVRKQLQEALSVSRVGRSLKRKKIFDL